MNTESPASAGQREHLMGKKRDQIKTLDLFSAFSCYYNVLVRWFRLYRIVSGVKTIFRCLPKMGAEIFISPFLSGNQASSLTFYIQLLTHFQTRVIAYLSPGLGRKTIYVSNVSTPGNSGFFLVIFNYCSIYWWLADR